MNKIISYITARKWIIVLVVVLLLVVPYEVKTKPDYGHPACIGKQNSTETTAKSLTYEYHSYSICYGLIHYSFSFPAGTPRYFRAVFMWTAIGVDDGHYQFWVFDYRNDRELIFWLPPGQY